MSYKRRVMLGPFLGELGWEISAWQAWCRQLAYERPGEYYAISFPDREILYKDFATFVPLRANISPDSSDSYTNRDVSRDEYFALVGKYLRKLSDSRGAIDEVIPVPYIGMEVKRARAREQKFAMFGDREKVKRGLVVVFPRQRQGKEAFRNWQQPKWVKLVNWLLNEKGKTVVICGRKDQACLVEFNKEGLINIIGADLGESVKWLNKAEYAISPQSGTSTLSLLSGCPLFGFGLHDHKQRTEVDENPLGTFAIHYHDGKKQIPEIELDLMKDWVSDFEQKLFDKQVDIGGF